MNREVLLGILNAFDQALTDGEASKDPELLEALWPMFAGDIRGHLEDSEAATPDALGTEVIEKLIGFLESPRKVAFAVLILKKANAEFAPKKV